MARNFHAAAGVGFPFSAPAASLLFEASLTDPDRLCLVYESGGAAVGVLAAYAAPHPFAVAKTAQELMWWIEPDYRGAVGLKMLQRYELWARSRGCAFIHMVGLGSEPATSKLYERQGYAATELHFMKPLSA
jgi:GNAT superfamily N-acetyltransferase